MAADGTGPEAPAPPDARDRPRIGVDEWVAQVEGRRERYTGLRGAVQRYWERLPPAARVLVVAAPAAVFPYLTTEGNVFRYGLFTLVYALLAVGLNIVVGFAGHVDLTGGSNGIANIDPFNFFGYKLESTRQQYYFLLVAISIVLVLLYWVHDSRTGRAWRALREDPLAAEAMSIPVNRLKLLAFVFGAAAAGFTGAIYGTIATAALPGDYDVGLLITIYAIMILGGFGSLMGIVVGAVVVSSVPELLRSSANARPLFYGAILLALLVKVRPWPRLVAVLGGLVAFGFAAHAIASAAYPRLVHGHAIGSGAFAHAMNHWMLLPSHHEKIADVAYVFLIAAVVIVPQLKRLWRTVLIPPLLYLVMFVWENLLLEQIGGATRLILLGALLVALMNARPQGLFGNAYVEIA